MTHHVILDTDIGSDVDDALALGVLLGSPEVDLVGVTTVYGDTTLRARLASRLARLAGREITVVPGESETLTGRDVWWAGHEGKVFDDLADEPVSTVDGVRFLVDTVLSRPGEIDLVAIGPLTNVARAIRADDRFAGALRHLYVMGGRFDRADPEHNFRSDPEAADIVYSAGIGSTTTGLEVTQTVQLAADGVERIAAAGAFGAALKAEIAQWWRFNGEQWNTPHDPLTVLTMLTGDLFEYATGTVTVDPGDGISRLTEGAGTARVSTSVRVGDAAEQMIARIVAAS